MKKYNEQERAKAITQQVRKIREFLNHTCSYAELMMLNAKAEAQVLDILRMVPPDKADQCNIDHIAEYFYFAIQAIGLLEPFAVQETNNPHNHEGSESDHELNE